MCCSNLICETFLIQDGVGVSKKMHQLKTLDKCSTSRRRM